MARWREVTTKNRCLACGGGDWCAWTPDSAMLKCERSTTAPPNMFHVRNQNGGALFRPARDADHRHSAGAACPQPDVAVHFDDEARGFASALGPEQLTELASTLGVRPDALQTVGAGWATADDLRRLRVSGAGWHDRYPDGAYAFPERDGTGRLVGFCFRSADGRKGAPGCRIGAHRGLIVPSSLAERADPVLVAHEAAAKHAAALGNLGGGEARTA